MGPGRRGGTPDGDVLRRVLLRGRAGHRCRRNQAGIRCQPRTSPWSAGYSWACGRATSRRRSQTSRCSTGPRPSRRGSGRCSPDTAVRPTTQTMQSTRPPAAEAVLRSLVNAGRLPCRVGAAGPHLSNPALEVRVVGSPRRRASVSLPVRGLSASVRAVDPLMSARVPKRTRHSAHSNCHPWRARDPWRAHQRCKPAHEVVSRIDLVALGPTNVEHLVESVRLRDWGRPGRGRSGTVAVAPPRSVWDSTWLLHWSGHRPTTAWRFPPTVCMDDNGSWSVRL